MMMAASGMDQGKEGLVMMNRELKWEK